jgi:hypothetical protein
MRESAITAGVDDTLPVIAQDWFCSSFPMACLEQAHGSGLLGGSQSVQALRVPGRCGLLRNGLALRDRNRRARLSASGPSGADAAADLDAAGQALLATFCGAQEAVRRRDSRSECGSGGWPGPHFNFQGFQVQLPG